MSHLHSNKDRGGFDISSILKQESAIIPGTTCSDVFGRVAEKYDSAVSLFGRPDEWNFHSFATGSASDSMLQRLTNGALPGWCHGVFSVGGTGHLSVVSVMDSIGRSAHTVGIGEVLRNIMPSGMEYHFDYSAQFTITKNKQTFIGVDTFAAVDMTGVRGYTLLLAQKKGSSFSPGNLEGTWNVYGLYTMKFENMPPDSLAISSRAEIDGRGVFTWEPVKSASGSRGTMSHLKVSIDSNGIVTTSDRSFHGVMNNDKRMIVCTAGSSLGSSFFAHIWILLKSGASFTRHDLPGSWIVHGLKAGSESQRQGWFYGIGNFSAEGVHTWNSIVRSDRNSVFPGAETFSIATDGIMTSIADTTFHGAMSSDRSMIVGIRQDRGGGSVLMIFQR